MTCHTYGLAKFMAAMRQPTQMLKCQINNLPRHDKIDMYLSQSNRWSSNGSVEQS